MGQVLLQGIGKSFGDNEVVRGVDLEVRDGEFMVFVGPSGCGKTTLLRMIAGLESITRGDLVIDGKRANHVHPSRRGAAMVFQSYALYPHMTVAENMGFALQMAGVARSERDAQVRRVADILRITDLLARTPKELSGGQRQRVAIGRAIVRRPTVFLFDEPLSNLDAALRVNMRIELTRLHRELGSTMIYVTHDQVEAMTMGDRIAVFNQGRLEQVGAPLDLYLRPANEFVAGFLGAPRMNFVDRPSGPVSAEVDALWTMLARTASSAAARAGIRPEHLRMVPTGEGVKAEVVLVEHLGDSATLHVRVNGWPDMFVAKVTSAQGRVAAGAMIGLWADAREAMYFDAEGRRIGVEAT